MDEQAAQESVDFAILEKIVPEFDVVVAQIMAAG